ncbi:MAG: LysR substrate-binding domain-containing protein [Burkholderiaceae bacterium]
MRFSGRLLEAFLALEETRRFVVAASRCHVSPSGFSQMIGKLEEQVGTKLFDRSTRTVTLTPEGEAFAVSARRIAAEIEASLDELKARSALKSGSVTIAGPPSLCASWLPHLLARFRAEHPGITLKLRDVVSDKCLEVVLRGEADFGVDSRHGNELEFETMLQTNERFYLICRLDDPLASLSSVSLRRLRGRNFIHVVRTGTMWQQIQEDLQRAGVKDVGLAVDQFSTVAGLVDAGFGISVIPQFALPLCHRTQLTAVPVTNKKFVRPLFLVKRRGRTLSLASEALWRFMVEQTSATNKREPARAMRLVDHY